MNHAHWSGLVLSIYPTTRGFAYALFEGPMSPVDWGVKEVRGPRKNARCLDRISKIIERYQPDTLVIEDCFQKDSRRSARIRRLNRATETIARSQAIDVFSYSRPQVRQCFEKVGASTKYEIAHAISRLIPALSHRMPPTRKAWMSEDARMSLFDAASLAWAFYLRGCGPPGEHYQSVAEICQD